MKKLLYILFVSLLFSGFVSTVGYAQNALVINGDYIVMSGGTQATNNFIVVDQPNTTGIIRTGAGGYIISEAQYNYVKWNAGANTGTYIFPFGMGAVPANYIPFTFNKTTAGSANVFTSTWHTNAQNMPHPTLSDVAGVTSMNCSSMNALGDSVTAVIDRFWDIQTTATTTANLTFSYLGTENTTSNPTGTFEAEHWNGAGWDVPIGAGSTGVTGATIGTVGPTTGQSTFSPWALVSLPTTYTATGSTTICNGSSAVLTATGGSTYTWMPGGATTSTISVSPGTTTVYSVTGKNSNGCAVSAPVTVTVTVNPSPVYVVSPSTSTTICTGASASFTVSGANTYTWNTSATTASITVSPALTTTYSVIGTSTNNCINPTPLTVTVTVNPLPTYTLTSAASPTICAGGSSVISVTGANSYTWSTGATPTASIAVTPTITTTYSVIGTSAAGCTNPTPLPITVNVNAPPTLSFVGSNTYTICNGSTQVLSVNPSSLASYTWSPGGASTSSVSVNPSTTTIYTVSGTASGCMASNAITATVNVNQPPALSLTGSANVVCLGSSTGAATVSATAGSSPSYTVNWDNGAVGLTNTTLSAGTHTATITDANGCSSTQTVSIAAPTTSLSIAPVNTTTTACGSATGSATVTASGGWNSSYTYTWQSPIISTTNTANNIAANTYTVSVTDANGCVAIQTFSIVTPGSATITATASDYTICSGSSTTITPTGGTTYTITGGAIASPSVGASFTANPVNTTTYSILGADASGCVGSPFPITINVNITPTVSITSSNPVAICAGQTTTLTASGANTYTWSDGTTPSSSDVVSPSSTAVYTVTGTSAAGCSGASSIATVTVNVSPLPSYTLTSTASPTICSGGSTTLSVSGANTYTWTPGTTLNDSTIANPIANPTITTTYSVVGTSTAGCINHNSIAVTVSVTAPPTISIVGQSSDTICGGKSQILTVTPSTLSYTWTANPSSTITGANTANPIVSPTVTTTYTVSGTESGCSPSTPTTVTVYVNTPTVNLNSASLDTATCNQTGGVVNINLSNVGGGTAPYTFQWATVPTGSVVSTSTITPVLTNEPAGTYSLLVTDAHGCVATNTGTVSTTQTVPSISVTASFIPNSPIGTGSLTVSYTNTSTHASTYTWTLGNGTGSTLVNPPTTSYTAVGTYTVVLYAQNGACIDSFKTIVTIDAPTTLIIPNIFSPNGDGVNDQFFIINSGINSLTCYIYNRWGELLYTINAPNQAWDGRTPNGGNAPDGTYFYILQAQAVDGKTYKQNGPLTLVR